MSSPRLRVQFETLFEHFQGQDVETQLEDVTDILFCTRRNARIVLNKMEEEGWIEWHPAAGRGKLSQLIFKRSRADVSENLARRYLNEGKIGQAFAVLDQDAAKLTQVIESYLGVQHQEGLQVVRLPYYRQLSMLNPQKPMRRSEQHIARQVFSGLTRLDEEEQLQPDLAHAWQALSDTHWRFYLRPGVRFHNGNLLTTELIVQNLWQLRLLNLFAHIDRVDSPYPWAVDVHLQKPDTRLPLLLAEACAKILPAESDRNPDFDLMPVGTGPYKVVLNDEKRLVLQAFDGYFGFRPLLDRVEVWVIDEVHSSMVFPSLSNPMKTARGSSTEEVELDPGCTYLLLNRRNGVAKDEHWAHYLTDKLNALNLFRLLPEEKIIELGVLPAYGLKPGWYHHAAAVQRTLPPESKELTIAYHAQHPMFPTVANAIKQLLSQDGITVNVIKYEHTVVETENVDIWIKPMGIANHRDDALAGWLLNYSDIEFLSKGEDFNQWVSLIDAWRADSSALFPAKELGKSLVEKHQLIPMFHCWLGISKDQCGALQNAKCNALGWFDFSQVWVKPDLSEH
ncbi:SgrR family transcriptional regulator [Vibrio cholerae]|uniref:SgrR family transcriptional regulator n=1 Tax=Vibrio cholerae TaxID=666 RepID=A0A5C9QC48_VIBCL|nr:MULTISPECIES: SgrR family transcriptional regulator [Vibrio]EGS65822.1 bacterial extracellular solute-binding s, 5 Middle family protein [Vibrio paracholerae HE-09]EKG87994.1 bacterial extracellular solute-binding s, 5 Middle family protein [Vibrio paracholerae HE-16]MBN7280138.1 SgrR family transcriptional regulator [Vibrio paracholerae]MBN7282743.1 SgrR family transcriptional regulator [Vibrio paracholerae]MBW5418626.1 SgrR family transcriptional regulator [Vibrio cholerae]